MEENMVVVSEEQTTEKKGISVGSAILGGVIALTTAKVVSKVRSVWKTRKEKNKVIDVTAEEVKEDESKN